MGFNHLVYRVRHPAESNENNFMRDIKPAEIVFIADGTRMGKESVVTAVLP
jgi:hypothetical protein